MKHNYCSHNGKVFSAIFALLLIIPQLSLAKEKVPFVKKINIEGNTLIDPYYLENYMNLENGIPMTLEVMDLVVSELKANYNYHGYPSIEAYSTLKVKDGIMTIKVDEKKELKWGHPRAERAVLKQAFLHGITLKESKQKAIINTLVEGYKKEKLIRELVARFLVKEQAARMQEINSKKRAVLREKVFPEVREFQRIKKSIEAQETTRIKGMKKRILLSRLKKVDDSLEENSPKNLEYTDLDEFLDNLMFEEMLNPGL